MLLPYQKKSVDHEELFGYVSEMLFFVPRASCEGLLYRGEADFPHLLRMTPDSPLFCQSAATSTGGLFSPLF